VATLIRKVYGTIASGIAVGVSIALTATNQGLIESDEEVITVSGSWVGLDTAMVVKAANSVDLLKKGSLEIKEIICKPWNPHYSWPINEEDWKGDLEPYKQYTS